MVDFFTILLAATGVHFQMWVFTKFFDPDQSTFAQTDTFQRLAFFRAAIAPGFPAGPNQCPHILIQDPVTKRLPQISAARRI